MSEYEARGMEIGRRIDTGVIGSERIVNIPPSVLKGDYGRFATDQRRADVIVTDMISLHKNTTGPTILLDAYGAEMVADYLKAHFSTFGSLDNVVHIEIPENLPSMAPFSLRPALERGIPRDEAIPDVIDSFHRGGELLMGESFYHQNEHAVRIIEAVIRSLFDEQYLKQVVRENADSFTISELDGLCVDLYEWIGVDEPNPFADVNDEGSRKVLTDLLDETPEDQARNIVDTVNTRLECYYETSLLNTLYNNTIQDLNFEPHLERDSVILFEFTADVMFGVANTISELLISELIQTLDLHDHCRCTEDHQSPQVCRSTSQTTDSSTPECRTAWDDDHIVNLIVNGSWKLPCSTSIRRHLVNEKREGDLSIGLYTDLRKQLEFYDEKTVCDVLEKLSLKLAQQESGNPNVDRLLLEKDLLW